MQRNQRWGVRAPLGPLLSAAFWLLGPGAAIAQVVTDGSLGPAGPLVGPDYVIDAALGQLRGGNLFHSFQQLDVRTDESATFTGPDVVDHVIGRVTGGAPSTIDGLLASEIPGANLFLLNPMGVLFGENASLDVDGSFHVSTADYLRLADGSQFFADLGPGSELTLAPPAAFGFFEAPAGITVEGDGVEDTFELEVFEGESISLVGGDLRVEGASLLAPSGRVDLVSVASAGEVALPDIPEEPGFEVDDFAALGDIDLLERSTVDTSGDGGGTVVIRGGTVLVEDSAVKSDTNGDRDGAPVGVDVRAVELLVDGGSDPGADPDRDVGIFSQVRGAGAAGDILIEADRVEFRNDVFVTTDVDEGSGQGGDFRIETGVLRATGGSQIGTGTFADGDGGSLEIVADEVLFIGTDADGDPSGIFVSSDLDFEDNPPGGDAGSLALTANRLEVLDGARISGRIEGLGRADRMEIRSGSILVAGDGRISSITDFDANSPGGDLIITADRLVVEDGGEIVADNGSRDPGAQGGNIAITVGDLSLSRSGLIAADTFGPGDGGNVTIRADQITVDGSDILAESDGEASGNAGTLDIDASEITLREGGVIAAATFGAGDGGGITLRTDRLTVAGEGFGERSGIFASAENGSSGDAGSIALVAGTLEVLDGGIITAEVDGLGQGGTIDIEAGSVLVSGISETGAESNIATTALEDSVQAAGDLTMQADSVVVEDGGLIDADTEGRGPGGSLDIDAREITLRSGGVISAETFGAGDGGDITLRGDQVTLTDAAILASSNSGEADAGRSGSIIFFVADRLGLLDGSLVSVETERADAGSIEVQARTWVLLRDQSGIATSVADGQGNGGNISIDPEFVILDEGFIVANAVQGAGGNISIVTGTFLPSADSIVSASSELGVDGIIEVRSPDTTIIEGTIQLPESVLSADALFEERCSQRANAEQRSSFRVEGAGGLPAQPGGLLPAGSSLAPSRPSTDRRTPEAFRVAAIRLGPVRVGCDP